jgi:hypothetical protein
MSVFAKPRQINTRATEQGVQENDGTEFEPIKTMIKMEVYVTATVHRVIPTGALLSHAPEALAEVAKYMYLPPLLQKAVGYSDEKLSGYTKSMKRALSPWSHPRARPGHTRSLLRKR